MTIDVNHVDEEECMFKLGMYFSVLYCSCFKDEILMDMLEDQSREEVHPNLE